MENLTITTLIIIITCITSYMAEENPSLKQRWMHNPYQVYHKGEYYRWLTSGFIHSGYIHLAFNMLVLYNFGTHIENFFRSLWGDLGMVIFVIFYLSAIVLSDMPSFIRYKDTHLYNSLGASGGVSAIVFALLLLAPLAPIGLMFLPGSIPGFIFAGLYLFYCYYMAQNSNDNVGHSAHLIGSLYGVVFMIAVYPESLTRFIEQISQWRGFF
jgi:membrane associated rhomboid family serine protease